MRRWWIAITLALLVSCGPWAIVLIVSGHYFLLGYGFVDWTLVPDTDLFLFSLFEIFLYEQNARAFLQQGTPVPLFPAAVVAFLFPWLLRGWQRMAPRPGACQTCGFSLTGNVTGVCPECGTPRPEAEGGAGPMREQLVTVLRTNGLDRVAEQLAALSRVGVELRPVAASLPRWDGSRAGGDPALPAGERAAVNGTPLRFLLQLNLGDLAERPGLAELPADGILFFFLAWNDEEGAIGCRVIHSRAGEDVPATDGDGLATGLMARSVVSLPEAFRLEPLDLSDAEFGAYVDAAADGLRTQLLGHPHAVQEDVGLAFASVFCEGDTSPPRMIPGEDVAWRLLLQVDCVTCPEWELAFGAGTMIYFMIHERDLAARRFDDVRAVAQFGP